MTARAAKFVPWAGALALFLAALLARVWFLRVSHYDGLYGLDPYAYFDYTNLLRAALLHGEMPPPFHWPLGYPLLCFVFSLFTGPVPLAGQAASVFAGAMCPVLVYWLVLQCRRDAWLGALLGGASMGAAHYALSMSMSYMSDLPALMWSLLAANAMLAYCAGLRARWLALAAVALALALLTRWVAALMVAPLGLAALAAYFERRADWRVVARHAGLAVAAGGAVLALHFAPSLLRHDAKVSYAGNLRDYTWSPANFFHTEFESGDGHITWPQSPAEYYLWPLYDPKYVLPVFTPLLLVGLVAMFRRAPRPASVLLVSWAVVFYLFFAGVYMQNPRFPLSYFPPLVAAFALGVDACARFASDHRRAAIMAALALPWIAWTAWKFGTPWGLAVAGAAPLLFMIAQPRHAPWALAAAAVLCAYPHVRTSVRDIHYTQTVVIPREIENGTWASSLVPEDKLLLVQGNSMVVAHNVPQRVIDLFNLTDAERDDALARDGVVYLMIDPAAIEKQWAGRRPMQHLDWFRANTELTELGVKRNYRVFRATPSQTRATPAADPAPPAQ